MAFRARFLARIVVIVGIKGEFSAKNCFRPVAMEKLPRC